MVSIKLMRNRTDTAVFSVVYPGVEPFFPKFLKTLSKQTEKEFTLFLINDEMPGIEKFLKGTKLNVKIKNASAPAAVLRKLGIRWVKKAGAKVIIFADSDDYFSENRVELSKDMLSKYDLIFNELILTDHLGKYSTPMLKKKISDGEIVSYRQISKSNCMGLTNTALKLKNVPFYMDNIPEDIIAFDWALFALCLHAGIKGVFTDKTVTYYRQHDKNIAAPHFFMEEKIMQGVQVKRDHYKLLSGVYKEYVHLADQFQKLLMQLQADEVLKRAYCQAVRKYASDLPLWWEPIKLLEELGL